MIVCVSSRVNNYEVCLRRLLKTTKVVFANVDAVSTANIKLTNRID